MRKKQFPFYGVFVLCTTLLCQTNSNALSANSILTTNQENIHQQKIENGQRADSSERTDSVQRTDNIQKSDTTKTIYSNLEEIILSASFIRERQSPLRLSTVDRSAIEKKGIGQTYPELIKNIPGIYATSESGSYGDAKINIRGFKQENISVQIGRASCRERV